MNLTFFKNRRILVTGHTGFKGSWMTALLLDAGAVVAGYALDPPTCPSLFDKLCLHEKLGENDFRGDIRDFGALKDAFNTFRPEFVLHMAAQPIVRESYAKPRLTYETNVMGTVNVLECVRQCPSVRSVLNVTTDKVYENTENDLPLSEEDRLDGFDPYSNSKSCSELVTHAYVRSFFKDMGIPVSTARAGNVIGGGDYASDRLLPDCIRAAKAGKTIVLRNPDSVRPFQHVLEPLYVYLLILKAQYEDPSLSGAYNVGPDEKDCRSVRFMAETFCRAWGEGLRFEAHTDGGPHEARLLRLNNEKLKKTFGWKPVWDAENAVLKTVEFEKSDLPSVCVKAQTEAFFADI
ncbi:MAG: CDP-glucose 4,6-dehydratase [Clostridia bacterium]|nr:CDP-glucose 4,6-dehydratase [Clostridia bacterium]MBQ9910412.1 CDP-glucose 4,6-dehydratase [Lachnospiraceae bacterium]